MKTSLNRSAHLENSPQTHWDGEGKSRAFTLIELLVVLAILALLAATFLPALAGTKRNSKRAQCLANLRQIYVGCSVYANDFSGWYPVWGGYDTAHPINKINGIVYYRYMYFDDGPEPQVMPRGYAFGTGPFHGWDFNLGYLYGGGMISDGHAFFCPAFSDMTPASPNYNLTPEYYSTPEFMSTHGNNAIRSSYMFNPRMKTATTGSLRAYQKVTDVKQLDVFTVDYLSSNIPSVGAPFTPDYWAHWPGKGLQAGFTDGSARFCTLAPADFNNIVRQLNSDQAGGVWAAQYNVLFNYLRNAP
jgi:prepilin-type N-terminal cleavage/methylation domain-containing protein